jgi:class 3 adenylate cyclase
MVGERRVVTMLFCDVKGSTSAAENMDPEDWTDVINSAFEHMIRPIYKYEGTVARLMGDGILAFFGAPIAHEDDPARAVLAGLDIVTAMQSFCGQIQQQYGIDFNVRVGINTGLVVVGAVGSDLRMEYTAIGDAINLAARMEQTAAPGTVQISQDTYKLVKAMFQFEDLGGIEVKGRNAPIQAYRVLGRKTLTVQSRGIEDCRLKLSADKQSCRHCNR